MGVAFWLGDVPGVMRRQGWTKGAECMERWFRYGAYIMSAAEKAGNVDYRTLPGSLVETRICTMAWAMRFERVRQAAEALRTGWNTPASAALLRRRLGGQLVPAPDGSPREFRFGDLSAPTVEVNAACQANSRSVGGIWDPFDDFYAAIGRGTLNLAVTGRCRVEKGKARLVVDGIGVYLRDSYEFIGDQFLGYWNGSGVTGHALNTDDIATSPHGGGNGDWTVGIGRLSTTVERYHGVSNQSFNDYRQASGKGGDFVIFTDVLRLPLPHGPVEVTL